MKIICNKREFADMIIRCAESNVCAECALYIICDISEGTNNLVDLCEIREQED